jgi:hypothetical protein
MNALTALSPEADLGALMLASERKAGKVSKLPVGKAIVFGAAVIDRVKWRIKVLDLVAALEGKEPQNRTQLGWALGCHKETAAARADEAIRQGMVRRIKAKGHSDKNPIFVYAIGKGGNT